MLRSNGSPRGPAVHRQVAVPAVRILAGLRRGGEIKFHVVGYEYVQVAVVIVIEKGASRVVAGAVLLEARFHGDVFEATAAYVVIECQASPRCDQQVNESVVIEIACAHTLAPAVALESGLFGYIREMAVAIVAIQTVRATRS